MRIIIRIDGSNSRYGSISMRRQLREDGGELVASSFDFEVNGVTLMRYSFDRCFYKIRLSVIVSGNVHVGANKLTCPEERDGVVSLL